MFETTNLETRAQNPPGTDVVFSILRFLTRRPGTTRLDQNQSGLSGLTQILARKESKYTEIGIQTSPHGWDAREAST